MITGPWLVTAVATYCLVTGMVIIAIILLVGRHDRSQYRAGFAAGRAAGRAEISVDTYARKTRAWQDKRRDLPPAG